MADTTPQGMLDMWLEAEVAIASGQEYEISSGGSKRRLRRDDLEFVRESISYLEKRVARASRGGRIKVRGVTPV